MTEAAADTLSLKELAGFFPKQLDATKVADSCARFLYGGSRGPGKSHWLRWYMLRRLLIFAGRGLRNVRVGLFSKDYPTLRDRQISKIATDFPPALGEIKSTQINGLGFYLREEYGGGIIALRNLADLGQHQGGEFADIGIEEVTDGITAETYDKLTGSLRWPGVEDSKMLAVGNPGGIGHLFVKARWIDHVLPDELKPFAADFKMVKALPGDNPFLPASYWTWLNGLAENLRRAWRDGDWDVFEGQAFTTWAREKDGQPWHVCKPFEIPPTWKRWRGLDWGHAAPFACLWIAQDPATGRVYVYREAYQAGLTDRAQARLIKSMTPAGDRPSITWADPSMWTKKTMEDRTFSTADEYLAEGVVLTKADNDRMTGKRKIDTLLETLEDGRPGLVVFDTCLNLIRTLPALPYDKTNVEDVDSEAEDHAYDGLRYALRLVNPRPRLPKPAPAAVKIDPILKRLGQQRLSAQRHSDM